MADIGTIVTRLVADVADYKAKLTQAQQKIADLEATAKRGSSTFSGMGGTIAKFAAGFVGVTAAVQATRTAIHSMIANTTALDTAMGQVDTLTDKSRASFGLLTDQVKELSRNIPKSAADLGMGLYQTISAGVQNTSDAMTVLTASSKLAASGLLDTFTAVDAVTTAMNAYGIKAANVTDVTDSFFNTVKEGKVTVATLASSIGTAATSAALAGVSLDDLGAAIATITKLGIDAQTTTTSLNRLFLAVAQAQDKTTEAAKRMGLEWSVSALRAKGLAKFIGEIATATKGDIDALTALGLDLRAARSLFVLAGSGAAEFARVQDTFATKSGATQTAFEKTNARIDAQWKLVKNRLNVEMETFGSHILPMVVGALLRMTDGLEGVNAKVVRLLTTLGLSGEATKESLATTGAALHEQFAKIQAELEASSKSGVEWNLKSLVPSPSVMGLLRKGPQLPKITFDVEVDRKNINAQLVGVAQDVERVASKARIDPNNIRWGQELEALDKRSQALQRQLSLLDDYERLQKEIRENTQQTLQAYTGLSGEALNAIRPLKDVEGELAKQGNDAALVSEAVRKSTGGIGTFAGATAAVLEQMRRKMEQAKIVHAELLAAMGGTGEKRAIDATGLRALGYKRLNDALDSYKAKLASATVQLPFAADEEAASKLRSQIDEATKAVAVLSKMLVGIKIPVLDFKAIGTADTEKKLSELRDRLSAAMTLYAWPTLDPEAKRRLEMEIGGIVAEFRRIASGQPIAKAANVVWKQYDDLKAHLEDLRVKVLYESDPTAKAKLQRDLEEAAANAAAARRYLIETPGAGVAAPTFQGTIAKVPGFAGETPNIVRTFNIGLKNLNHRARELGITFEKVSKIDLGDRLKNIFDLKEIGSNFVANLASGFVGSAIGKLTQAFTGLFDRTAFNQAAAAQQQALIAAQKDNTEWLKQVSKGLADVASTAFAQASPQTQGVVQAVQEWLAAMDSFVGGLDQAGEKIRAPNIGDYLAKFGVSLDDVIAVMKQFGITWTGAESDYQRFLTVVMSSWQNFSGGLDLLNKSLDAADIEKPLERFKAQVDFIATKVSPEFAKKLQELAKHPEELGQFIQDFIKRLQEGDLSVFTDLNQVSVSDFLNWVTGAESSLDGLSNAADSATGSLLNVPTGYKVALARFQADTGEVARGLRDRMGNAVPGPTDIGLGQTDTGALQRAAGAFSDTVTTFSSDAMAVLDGQLLPAMQAWADAFANPLTGARFGKAADMLTAPSLVTLPNTSAPVAQNLGATQPQTTSGNTIFQVDQLTVVSNDPDDMLQKIQARARQKARLGGVSQLDMAVSPVGQRGTPTGVR